MRPTEIKPCKADEIWCYHCLGCERLSQSDFKGVTSCDNFVDDGIVVNKLMESVIKSWEQQRLK